MFYKFSITAFFLLAGSVSLAEIEFGDYLFLKAQVIGCGEALHYIDYAEVSAYGEAVFLNGIQIHAAGKTAEEITLSVNNDVEKNTGKRPATIEIVVVPKELQSKIAVALIIVGRERENCSDRQEHRYPPNPSPEQGTSEPGMRLAGSTLHNRSIKLMSTRSNSL